MLVKTINQFGRHIPSAGGHEGGEGPGPRRSPTPFPDGCVGSRGGGQARPLWSKKAQLCVRVIIGERESGRPGSGWQQPRPAVAHSQSLYFCREQRETARPERET